MQHYRMRFWFHLFHGSMVAAIWWGIARQQIHHASIFHSEITTVVNPLAMQRLIHANDDLLEEIYNKSQDYPSPAATDNTQRSLVLDSLFRTGGKVAAGKNITDYWKWCAAIDTIVDNMTDHDFHFMKFETMLPPKQGMRTAAEVLQTASPDLFEEQHRNKLQLTRWNANNYLVTRLNGISCWLSFGHFIPYILPEQVIKGHVGETISFEAIVSTFGYCEPFNKISFYFQGENLPREKEGIINVDTIYPKPGIQRIPFYMEYRSRKTNELKQFRDTVTFVVSPK